MFNEEARLNRNIEVLTEVNNELLDTMRQLADDKGAAYWTPEEVRKIAQGAIDKAGEVQP